MSTGPLSPDDFARLYQAHWKALWCVAAAIIRDRTLAHDIVQQAAVVGLQRLDSFDPATSFPAWMMQIVRNISLNESRKRTRRRTGHADPHTLDTRPHTASIPTAGVVTGTGQLAPGSDPFDDDLRRAVDNLDQTARGCLLMRVVLDMPYRDIALALGVPEGTAASHVHRARAALRLALTPRETGPAAKGVIA